MVKEERREWGCDGCRKDIPTECFEGYCGNTLWLCYKTGLGAGKIRDVLRGQKEFFKQIGVKL